LNSASEHVGFWLQLTTMVFRTYQQFDGTFAMIAHLGTPQLHEQVFSSQTDSCPAMSQKWVWLMFGLLRWKVEL
jgi:hypothetical protein